MFILPKMHLDFMENSMFAVFSAITVYYQCLLSSVGINEIVMSHWCNEIAGPLVAYQLAVNANRIGFRFTETDVTVNKWHPRLSKLAND